MSLNKTIIMGNLVADPDARATPSGVSVTSFRVAVSRDFAKADDKIKTDFFNVVAWRNTADFVARNFVKGKAIAVVGKLQNRSYTDSDGKERWLTEIVADECYFAGGATVTPKAETPTAATFEELNTNEDLPF